MVLFPTLSLTAAVLFWPLHPGQTVTLYYRARVWDLAVTKDRFTGAVTCRLFQGPSHSPRIAYARKSLAFRFSSHLDTLNADYRVDTGPVAPWTGVYPQLVAQGATLPGGSLENPTSGLVILPTNALPGAHAVTIRPTPRSRPRSFALDGLGDALARAAALGCTDDADFVR